MPKIVVEPVAAESFGVRSMATFVRTPDTSVVIDPGCSLGQRMRLDPHPKEYEALLQANQRLIETCKKAEILIISHFHYDHLKPTFTDYHFILSNRELAEILYTDKIILAKDFRENINTSQRQRGYYFNKFTKNSVKEIIWADKQTFEFGNTVIQISKPLPHGEHDSKQGFVVSCKIQYDDETFVFATVQGPIVPETLKHLLSLNPMTLYVGGPPLYLSGFRILDTTLELAKSNMIELARHVPVLIIDHHLLRAPNWKEWLSPVYHMAEISNHWIGTAADFSKRSPEILEAIRKDLYKRNPPPEEFIQWTKQSKKYKKNNLPPNLHSLF
ncbi:MAG: MBL fold metallo-hydrolase [Candidatus Helarchaeota archaeon]|nr:MBL fold metallo-hydrolase [Candidatus Helarchaeota archaeon]